MGHVGTARTPMRAQLVIILMANMLLRKMNRGGRPLRTMHLENCWCVNYTVRCGDGGDLTQAILLYNRPLPAFHCNSTQILECECNFLLCRPHFCASLSDNMCTPSHESWPSVSSHGMHITALRHLMHMWAALHQLLKRSNTPQTYAAWNGAPLNPAPLLHWLLNHSNTTSTLVPSGMAHLWAIFHQLLKLGLTERCLLGQPSPHIVSVPVRLEVLSLQGAKKVLM